MAHVITHDEAASRYVVVVDGKEAGFASYTVTTGGVLDFDHTEVYEEFQGQGLSKPLIKRALDDVRASGRSIIATCSAVEGFLEKNPQYKDLLAEQ